MTMEFRVKNLVPPGGRYFYEVPETGVRLEDPTSTGILRKAAAHLRENSLEVPKDSILMAKIQDHMCRYLPDGFCFGDDSDGPPRAKVLTIQQIKTKTCSAAAGNPRVSPGTARSRAAICSKCPSNDRSACPSCVGITAWSTRLAGQSIGGMSEWLGVCEVDAVALPTKIFLKNVPDSPDYPDGCWRNDIE